MRSLSQALNSTFGHNEKACQKGVDALGHLANARLALQAVEESGTVGGVARMRAHEEFSQAQENARQALRPLVGMSPKSVGPDFYETHWSGPLQALGRTFSGAFGRTDNGLNEVTGFNFTEMVHEGYRPTPNNLMQDTALQTLPVQEAALGSRQRPQTSFDFNQFAQDDRQPRLSSSRSFGHR